MPGLPSTISTTESPIGCTKQLIKVAASVVPAAGLMRPAGTKPFSCAHRKRASHWPRCFSSSLAASARATRRRTSCTEVSLPLAYFSTSTSPEISCSASRSLTGASAMAERGNWCTSWLMVCPT